MASQYAMAFLDYSNERSSVAFPVATPSGAAYDFTAFIATLDAIGDAVEAVTLCTRGKETVLVDVAAGSVALPSDAHAQRELGLRVFYHDTTTNKKYHVTIPGPDLDTVGSQGYDDIDWSITEMAALETALEANMLSPVGNAIQIDSGKIVGRRS